MSFNLVFCSSETARDQMTIDQDDPSTTHTLQVMGKLGSERSTKWPQDRADSFADNPW